MNRRGRIFLATMAVGLLIVGGHQALAQRSQPGTHVDVLPPVGLTFGERARISFVNTSAGPITIDPCWHDPEGAIVKQQTLTLRAGQTRWLDISRSELPERTDMRVQLRAGVVLQNPADARSLMASGEIIDELSGKTTAFVSPGAVLQGYTGNHNETFVVDDGLADKEEK
jgi:hypothetical protein